MSPRRPLRRSQVVHRLAPRGPEQPGAPRWLWLGVPVLAVLALLALIPVVTQGVALPTAIPSPTLRAATREPATPNPVTFPTETPTFTPTPVRTRLYLTQSGDTLPALAARFGVPPESLIAPEGLRGTTTLAPGQLLVIPDVLPDVVPGTGLIPNSELVFTGSSAGFDPQQFVEERGGYLAQVKAFVDGRTLRGGDALLHMAENHAINPRLLVALLEFQSGWVTNSQPEGDALSYPLGYIRPDRTDVAQQLSWAATQLAVGYYGWRAGTITELTLADGSQVRLDPALNAGTVALQYFFAQTRTRAQWEAAIGAAGFIATYQRLFGDPFARTVDPLIPQDLTPPPLSLPFLPGRTWFFSGGPHGAWELGGAQAALDFAPSSLEGGCAPSEEWVTAVAAGIIVRAGAGSVLLDLDGDGREATGWVILYLHIADEGRVQAGEFVEQGDRIGHPSCEGGQATGTHVHIARKYNGEWIVADSLIPFTLSGWVTHQGDEEYAGTLVRGDQTVKACRCTAGWTAISADP